MDVYRLHGVVWAEGDKYNTEAYMEIDKLCISKRFLIYFH